MGYSKAPLYNYRTGPLRVLRNSPQKGIVRESKISSLRAMGLFLRLAGLQNFARTIALI